MIWHQFAYVAIASCFLWLIGMTGLFLTKKVYRIAGSILYISGILLLGGFIAELWIVLERPPLRTLGETRLWYAFFISLTGYIIFLKWKYKWFLLYSIGMTFLFLFINLLHPENFDKSLMPALQSPWFVPHVVVYILGYALLGVATLASVYGLYKYYQKQFDPAMLHLADNLSYLGFGFVSFGLLFGALWAKEAWGHYWTWDPKETWAFITWLGYLIYIHIRLHKPQQVKLPLWILSLAFVLLLIAWFGVNYLPSAQNSVHVYSN